MTRHRMDTHDAAWLHMGRPTNLMVVNTLMWFDEQLDWDAVRTLLEERLIGRFPPFSQRVVEHARSVWWEDEEDFDLERHLHRVALPAPGRRAELERYVSSTLHKKLRPDRPLWELHFVDGYNGTGSALLSRIHHCIADGIAVMRVMMSLTDDPHEAAAGSIDHHSGPVLPLAQLAGGPAGDLVHPSRVVELAHDVRFTGRVVSKLLALPPDAHTSLRGHPGRGKRVVWSDPIALSTIEAAAHAGEVSVNDLLLTAVTGALRAHLADQDGQAPDIRAFMPVNLRPLDQPLPTELGNKLGLVFLSLPVSLDDPRERLAELCRRMAAIKHSAEGDVSFEILDLIGRTPYLVEQVIVDIVASKGTAVVTSVRGPSRSVLLAGRKMRGAIGWPPESGNLGLGLSLISYDREVTVGLMADTRLVRDPYGILEAVQRELDGLMRLCSAGLARGPTTRADAVEPPRDSGFRRFV